MTGILRRILSCESVMRTSLLGPGRQIYFYLLGWVGYWSPRLLAQLKNINPLLWKDKQALVSIFIHTQQRWGVIVETREQETMAQTLALPLAPSLSVICNGRNPVSLSNSLSFPVASTPKVRMVHLRFCIYFLWGLFFVYLSLRLGIITWGNKQNLRYHTETCDNRAPTFSLD